ncbi:hypothetical protein CC2G_001663 [Coprinopsis cinerea AmutBmut pab1-1]|nr:hypothetical protein CC2G_001663 [Coprinopsis cinerea AmutBmut pab1-1]
MFSSPFTVNTAMNVFQDQNQPFSFGAPQQDQQSTNMDPNSPELFKQNLYSAQAEVMRLQSLAKQTLAGVQNAYRPGYSPEDTAGSIEELKKALNSLSQVLRTTGVGSLPLLPRPEQPGSPRTPPSEAELLEKASNAVKALYELQQRKQDSAAVVANLLGAPDHLQRK